MSLIYHVTTEGEWEEAQRNGFYIAPSLETEGFIHCSEAWQVKGVLERYYSGKTELVKLVIDPQIKLLKHSFHRRGARQQLQLVAIVASCCRDIETAFDVLQVQRRINRRYCRIQRRTFA